MQDHNHQGPAIPEVMATVMQDRRVVLQPHNLQAGPHPIKEVQAAHRVMQQEAVQLTLHLQEAARVQHTQLHLEAVLAVHRDHTPVAVEAAAEATATAVAVEVADVKYQLFSK